MLVALRQGLLYVPIPAKLKTNTFFWLLAPEFSTLVTPFTHYRLPPLKPGNPTFL